MEYKDYYKILGVSKTATKEEIKKQYRKLARQYHPDVNRNDPQAARKFAEINEAHEVLADDEKRRKYDTLGSEWQQYQGSGAEEAFNWAKYAAQRNSARGRSSRVVFENEFNNTDDFDDIFGESDFSDFFRTIFGQGTSSRTRRSPASRGTDYKAELSLTQEEAYRGCVKVITLNGNNMRITLQPGIRDGQTIRLKGKGGQGRNRGEAGDLYITLKITDDVRYQREGDDLYMEVPLHVYTAMLGGDLEIETLAGKLKLKIQPGTQSGTTLRLKGKGFPVYNHRHKFGDLYVKLNLQVPENLTGRERTLVAELAKLRGLG